MASYVTGNQSFFEGVVAGEVIAKGAPVSTDPSTGFVRNITAGDKFRGFNDGTDVTGGASDGVVSTWVVPAKTILVDITCTRAEAHATMPVFYNGTTYTITNTSGYVHVGYTTAYHSANKAWVTMDRNMVAIADITIAS